MRALSDDTVEQLAMGEIEGVILMSPRTATIYAALMRRQGLGAVARNMVRRISVPFTDWDGLPPPSVPGHGGRFTLGDWAGRRVLVVEGRVHRYEGHSWDVVVLPVTYAILLGAKVVLTPASLKGS